MAGVHNFNAYFHRNNLETKEKEKKKSQDMETRDCL